LLPADLTIEDIVDDGIEVAEFLRERLGVERVILLGWSWGTVVGVEMARKRPDLVAAYVGTGQVTSIAGNEAAIYEATLAGARRLGESSAVTELEAIGAPPCGSMEEFSAVRMIAARLASQPSPVQMIALQLLAPRYSLLDHVSYIRGFMASGDHFIGDAMQGQAFTVDLPTTAAAFDVPIVFIQGAEDVVTPAVLARSYFDRLAAPHKVYVALEGAGHTAPIDNTSAFVAAMDEHVRPLAPAAVGAGVVDL
jgi:pimeloyl-ACP methyl ester carboxylesterase